jgi:hypothetical protein
MVPIGTVPINRDHCGHTGKPFIQVVTYGVYMIRLNKRKNDNAILKAHDGG